MSVSVSLVVTRTFFPKEGGIEEYVYSRCLQNSSRLVVLAADYPGADDFDPKQSFYVYRWFSPDIFPGTVINGVLKQFFSLIGSFFMSLWLYRKYRFCSIEWGHGYDFLSLLIISYLLPVQCFMYLHGNDLLCPLRNPIFKRVFSLTLDRLSGVICNSSFTQNYLCSNFSMTVPTYVINPSVRPEKFGLTLESPIDTSQRQTIRNRYQIPVEAVMILSVGRLVKRKGFEKVISQLPKLIYEHNLDIHYLICGRGAMESDLRTLANRLDVADRVHFAGYVSDTDLAHYYAACDLFAMLTFFNSESASIEGFGIVYLEAGFFNKPVIASRVGGVVDAIKHRENGILVAPDASSDQLCEALSELCRDQQLRDELGAVGRTFAIRRPSYEALSF